MRMKAFVLAGVVIIAPAVAQVRGSGTGTIATGATPETYRFATPFPGFKDETFLVDALTSKGFAVILQNPIDVFRNYEVPPNTIVYLYCTYLGHITKPKGTAARVLCKLLDLATSNVVYFGQGEYMGTDEAADFRGAVQMALERYPSLPDSGRILSAVPFPKRSVPLVEKRTTDPGQPTPILRATLDPTVVVVIAPSISTSGEARRLLRQMRLTEAIDFREAGGALVVVRSSLMNPLSVFYESLAELQRGAETQLNISGPQFHIYLFTIGPRLEMSQVSHRRYDVEP